MKNFMFLAFCMISLFSQAQQTSWFFGNNARLDFNGTALPTPTTGHGMVTAEGCAFINSPSGGVLFYTDGRFIYNSSGTVINPSNPMLGHSSSTSSAVIIPVPNTNDKYFIFTVDARQTNSNGLNVYRVSANSNGVSLDNNGTSIFTSPNCVEKLTAVSDGSCGYWVTARRVGTDFLIWHITDNSVPQPFVITVTRNITLANMEGYMKFSPDGTRLAVAHYVPRIIEIYNFNVNSGTPTLTLTNTINTTNLGDPYGIEFAPQNVNILYFNTRVWAARAAVYQMNLTGLGANFTPTNIVNQANLQRIQLTNSDNNAVYGALQTGPDGRIYMAYFDRTAYNTGIQNGNVVGQGRLACIQAPNVLQTGTASCQYSHNLINFGATSTAVVMGLPTVLASTFNTPPTINSPTNITGATFNSTNNVFMLCLGSTLSFSVNATDGQPNQLVSKDNLVTSYPAGVAISSNMSGNPYNISFNWTPTAPGIYQIVLGVKDNAICQMRDQKTYTIIVNEKPIVTISGNTHLCQGLTSASTTLTANSSSSGLIYLWNTWQTTQSITVSPTAPSTVYMVEATNGSGCKGTAAVTVTYGAALNTLFSTSMCRVGNNVNYTLTPQNTNLPWPSWEVYEAISCNGGTGNTNMVNPSVPTYSSTNVTYPLTLPIIPGKCWIVKHGTTNNGCWFEHREMLAQPPAFLDASFNPQVLNLTYTNPFYSMRFNPVNTANLMKTYSYCTMTMNGTVEGPYTSSATTTWMNNFTTPQVFQKGIDYRLIYTISKSHLGECNSSQLKFDFNFDPQINEMRVTRVVENGEIEAGFEDQVDFSELLNINDIQLLNNVKISPNPTSGHITIQHDAAVQSLQVFDMLGKLVSQTSPMGVPQTEMDLSELPAGVYFLQVDGKMAERIVKQ